MSTMTKERAAQIAAGGGFNFDEIAVLARIALASLEAEPVAEVCEGFNLRYIGYGPAPKSGVHIGDKLYTAPPTPVVPEEMPKGLAGQIVSLLAHNIGDKFLAQKIWNACRSAMLQGAEPVSNRDELPEGWVACSERLPPEGYETDGGAVCYLVWHKNEVDCGPQYSISNVFFLRKHWEKNFTHWMPLPSPPFK
ncbi:TPA: DUF551 domain-containing protein [Enterobacter hormaechei subsp. steigerwaltii]|nr:DUF551 domain-containing protein [Enterobacter hormaechei subsp. steigerwaltii]